MQPAIMGPLRQGVPVPVQHRPSAFVPLLLAAGCAAALPPMPLSEQLALQAPPDRNGTLVNGELVRATWVERGTVQLVASRPDDAGKKPVVTFAGPALRFQGGAPASDPRFLAALAQARSTSAFHEPVKVPAVTDLWVVHDVVPAGTGKAPEHLLTLEAYAADPRPRWAAGDLAVPERVWVVGRRGADGKETLVEGRKKVAMTWRGLPLRPSRIERAPDGRLVSLDVEPWAPELGTVLSGATAEDLLQPSERGAALAVEQLLTQALVDWRARGAAAQGTSPAELDALIATAEQGTKQLEARGRALAEATAANLPEGAGGQRDVAARAQLVDQRRALLGDAVASLRQARTAQQQAPASAPPAR